MKTTTSAPATSADADRGERPAHAPAQRREHREAGEQGGEARLREGRDQADPEDRDQARSSSARSRRSFAQSSAAIATTIASAR